MLRQDILKEAIEILKVREAEHGSPHDTFNHLAARWNMTSSQVCMLLAELKIERWRSNTDSKDNYLDAIGYIALAYELQNV